MVHQTIGHGFGNEFSRPKHLINIKGQLSVVLFTEFVDHVHLINMLKKV